VQPDHGSVWRYPWNISSANFAFWDSANFAVAAFCELRLLGFLGSSLTAWLRNGCRNAWQTVVL
jgi:hypothetical protein